MISSHARTAEIPGISYDGGYAEYMVAPAEALARIPDDLCRRRRRTAAVRGHHDVQRAARIRRSAERPCRGPRSRRSRATSASSSQRRWASRWPLSRAARIKSRWPNSLAHITTSTPKPSDVAEELNKLGGAQVVLATVTVADAMAATLGGLKARGQLVVVGAPPEPMEMPLSSVDLQIRRPCKAMRPVRRRIPRTRYAFRQSPACGR